MKRFVLSNRLPARRGVRILIAAAIGGNLLGAGGALYFLGSGEDLTVDRAIERFRRDQATTPGPGSSTPFDSGPVPARSASSQTTPSVEQPARPSSVERVGNATLSGDLAEGVYVYDTDGYEETDVLSGQRHTYPAQTTMTVAREGCGYVWRWQPMEERWDESEGCRRPAGILLERFSMYHEFFRRGIREDLACDPEAIVMPVDSTPGRAWRFTCRSDDTTIESSVRVLQAETLTVGGKRIRALHIRYDTAMTGANEGTHVQERWLAQETGLLLRMTTTVDARVETPLGRAAYIERYRIDLVSTTPSR